MEKYVVVYKTQIGDEPFTDWLFSLRDKILRHRIEARINRIESGNYGDHKRFLGIVEVRLDVGQGYRLYCGEDGDKIVVLLVGGDKSSQDKDIKKALVHWKDYHEQKKIENI
jgi:putative addiction module killer protein